MTDPKEALERLVLLEAEARKGVPKITATWAPILAADIRALISDRDRLEGEVERLEGDVRQLKHALPDCHVCGGHGTIEHAAKTTGANQHSACAERCDNCDGLGVEL